MTSKSAQKQGCYIPPEFNVVETFSFKINILFLHNPQINSLAFKQLGSPIHTVGLGSAIAFPQNPILVFAFLCVSV
jgi:hypothetical protein